MDLDAFAYISMQLNTFSRFGYDAVEMIYPLSPSPSLEWNNNVPVAATAAAACHPSIKKITQTAPKSSREKVQEAFLAMFLWELPIKSILLFA